MTAERKLKIANFLEKWPEHLLPFVAFGSLGLIPAMALGLWTTMSESLLGTVVCFACYGFCLAVVLCAMVMMVMYGIGRAFRESWWRETEDPWRVWQVDHYGKVID